MTTTPNYHAVIPTIGRSPYLLDLLERLLADPTCSFIDLPDNGEDERHALARLLDADDRGRPTILEARESGRILCRKTGGSIYRSWNEALDAARYTPVAILNDDIVLGSGSIAEALRHLTPEQPIVGLNYRRRVSEGSVRAPSREATGTFREGGIGGFAFVALPNYCARVDPRFVWWYGDDDLVYRTTRQLSRHAVVALGAPVDHPEPSLTGNQMPWLGEAIADDEALFRQLWPAA